MKKRISKLFMVMAAATIATVGIVGCKNQKAENETDNGASVEDTSNVDNEENEEGVYCIGASITNITGSGQKIILGAFSISIPIFRATEEKLKELSNAVLKLKNEINASFK